MNVENIIKNPYESLDYMERFVNDGSPSGFSFKYTTSKQTSPLYVSKYSLCAIENSYSNTIEIGKLPEVLSQKYGALFFVHPDWKNNSRSFNVVNTNVQVSPTASFRTVRLCDDDYYIKLCYPGILGRITRELKKEHINSSIDITDIFSKLIHNTNCPEQLAFMPEAGGKLFENELDSLGFVVRGLKPVGPNTEKIVSLIPAFSLFSTDLNDDKKPIIIQIIEQKKDKLSFLLDELLLPIIDCYFFCVFHGGIQPEMHSQNFLVGIDGNYNIKSIVFRDLESFDKDLEIIDKVFPNMELKSFPYKCICKSQYNYKIKHSFMFDHKLGEYFFDPIIKCLMNYNIVSNNILENAIKNYVRNKYKTLLIDFFPSNGNCYKFENILIDRQITKRPYISFYPPKYR